MIFFDIIILGLYFILDNSIYLNSKNIFFEAKAHSLLLSTFIHSLNIQVLLHFVTSYFGYEIVKAWVIALIALLIWAMGYFVYFKKNRFENLIRVKRSLGKKTLIALLMIVYVIVTFYFFLQ